jgi:putative modified peptide
VQRCIEVLIGRLITDEDFRQRFVEDPQHALAAAGSCGLLFSQSEIAALIATDSGLWERVADQIDPRLQKASLSRSR